MTTSNQHLRRYELDDIGPPDNDSLKQLFENLTEFNRQQAGHYPQQHFARFARDPDNRVVGGIYAQQSWDWLHLELLWVADELRGQGLGRQLLSSLEEYALSQNIHRFQVNTTSFQALAFYQSHGYEIFGELADLPPGSTSYFLKKVLSPR